MRLSAVITVNDRDLPTLTAVFHSMDTQEYDEFIIVLDAAPAAVAEFCRAYWIHDPRVRFVVREREPGWRCPALAWNAGFDAVTGDAIYCFSSETVQAPLNLVKARAMLAAEPAVYFGKAECSCGPLGQEVVWSVGAPGNLLCDAAHPRPLGFIWWAPTANLVRFDPAYDRGYWYDEADYFYRWWQTGLPFVFDDSVSGTHLHHERPRLQTPEGAAGIEANRVYTLAKYGRLDPLAGVAGYMERRPGRTVWRHM